MADIFLPEDSYEEQEFIFRGFANSLNSQRNSRNESTRTQEEPETKTDDENAKSQVDMKDNKEPELTDNQKDNKDIELNSNGNTKGQSTDPEGEKDNCGSDVSNDSFDFQNFGGIAETNNNERDSEESAQDAESGKQEKDSKENASKDDQSEDTNSDSNMDIDDMFSFPPPSVGQLLADLEGLADSEYIHHRQLAAKKILNSLRISGTNQEHLQLVISVMCRLSEDEESMVRSELVQHIPSIALFCQGHSTDLKRVIRQQLVPYTVKLLNDSQIGVRKLGQSALLVLLEDGLIDQSQLNEWIIPLVSQLALCESNLEELRIEDVTLMTRMIPFVGRDAAWRFFLEPYMTLCIDPASEIREICAMGFGILCRTVGTETTESSLLRVFHALCNDEVWGVRKACADVFGDVATVASLKTRKEVLSHIFISLLNDDFQLVKYAGYQSLGGFIYTFADPSQTGLDFVDGKLVELPSLELLSSNVTESPPLETPVLESSDTSKSELGERLCNGEDVWSGFKETLKCINKPKTDSDSNNEHLFLHMDNENVFNNFQFWRTPLPEVELDIDIDGSTATNIRIRAKVPGNGSSPTCTSEIKVCITPNEASSIESVQNSSSGESKASRMQVQTACINTITHSNDHQIPLQLDLGLNPSYQKESYMESSLTSMKEKNRIKIRMANSITDVGMGESAVIDEPLKKIQGKMTPYDQDIVPPELLARFISIAHQHFTVYRQCEEERVGRYCAYSFPAVTFTLGRKNWPCLQSTCEKLAKNTKWTIRRTIASCLHELAVILGQDLTARDLLPIFMDLLKDIDEVRMKLIMHLFEFLKQLQPEWRKSFLPLVEEFSKVDNERNWRFRCTVAEQLKPTVELFDSFEILKYFLPIALGYVQDKVYAVRIAAVELVAVIIKHLMKDEGTKCHVQSLLEEFDARHRQANKWIWRQTYVLLCQKLAEQKSLPVDMYTEVVVPKLFTLAWDNVPNVRMAVSRCIAVTLVPLDYLASIQKVNYDQLLQVMYNLQGDVDEDVRHFAGLSASAFHILPEKKLSPV